MKLLLSLFSLLALSSAALAEKPKFLEVGDHVQIQAVQPLAGTSGDCKIIDLSKDWVLVEFNSPVRKADGSAGTEKGQLWINFAHVISVRKVETQ